MELRTSKESEARKKRSAGHAGRAGLATVAIGDFLILTPQSWPLLCLAVKTPKPIIHEQNARKVKWRRERSIGLRGSQTSERLRYSEAAASAARATLRVKLETGSTVISPSGTLSAPLMRGSFLTRMRNGSTVIER